MDVAPDTFCSDASSILSGSVTFRLRSSLSLRTGHWPQYVARKHVIASILLGDSWKRQAVLEEGGNVRRQALLLELLNGPA